MKIIVTIVFLFSNVLFCQDPQVLDSLTIKNTNTEWEQFADYSKSNITVNLGGVISDYDNKMLYKNGVTGLIIDKDNGNVIQTYILKVDTENSIDKRVEGNWDFSRTSLNKIFSFDINVDYSIKFTISSRLNNKIDTIFSHTMSYQYFKPINSPKANYDFYNIDDKKFIIIYDLLTDQGPVNSPEYLYYLVDTEKEIVSRIGRYSGYLLGSEYSNFIVRSNDFIFSTTHDNFNRGPYEDNDASDSHEYFNLVSDTLNLLNYYGNAGNLHNWFNVILNDSLSTIIVTDSIKVFNFRNKTVPKSYFLNAEDKVIAKYHFEDKNIIALIIKQADGDKRVFAFHYPSYKILLDKIDNAPYLGEMLGELNDGNLLTIGDASTLYKHKWQYDFNAALAEFEYKLIDDNKIEFGDLSEGPIKSWSWDFGDGASSQERNPNHQYASSGKYTVILTITNEYGKVHQTSKEIEAKGVLKSNFEFTLSQDGGDKRVECTNLSPDIAVRYIWNFGDGTYSNEKNPIHTYNFPGKYYISLTAFDSDGKYKIYLKDEIVEVVE
ncbi:MAG: PKD domain-containing protein [Candidatus Kapaibacterium sp.]